MTTTLAATPPASRGDETTRLYAAYGDQLYRYCYARLRSREDAEDAVQSVFIRVHGALAKGVRPRFEAAWLYKIAHNVCLSRSEVTGRRRRHETPVDLADLEWSVAAPEQPLDRIVGLPAALASMPKNLRDAILLREWQGLSYAEIAEALGTTVSAVETLIFRARRHLAEALEPVEKTRRPLVARLTDLGALYGIVRIALARLRDLFAVGAPAKLATGAALLAIGGAVVADPPVGATDHHSPVRPATAPRPAPAAAQAATPTPAQAAPATPATHRVTTTAPAPGSAPAAAAAPVSAAAPTATTTATAPAAATTAPVPAPPLPATTTTAALPAVTVPTVTAPVELPLPGEIPAAVETVTAAVPTLPAPVPTVPTVTTPSATVPSLLP